jgi:hypothetical protein
MGHGKETSSPAEDSSRRNMQIILYLSSSVVPTLSSGYTKVECSELRRSIPDRHEATRSPSPDATAVLLVRCRNPFPHFRALVHRLDASLGQRQACRLWHPGLATTDPARASPAVVHSRERSMHCQMLPIRTKTCVPGRWDPIGKSKSCILIIIE